MAKNLWRIDDPTSPGSAVLEGSFPSGLGGPAGITSQGGSLYVVDFSGDELWRIDDPTSPGSAVLEGSFPSGIMNLAGITSQGGSLYVVDDTGDELWRIDDPTNPGVRRSWKAASHPVSGGRPASLRKAVRSTWWTSLAMNCGG